MPRDCWHRQNYWSRIRYPLIRFRYRCRKPDSSDDDDGGDDDGDGDDADDSARRALWEVWVAPCLERFEDSNSMAVAVAVALDPISHE